MGAFKFSSLWLLFSVTYFGFFSLIFLFFPEMWLYKLLLKPDQDFIEEETWDTIFMSVVLLLALVVNSVFIFFSLATIQQVRKSFTNGFRYYGGMQMSTFKFSALWLLFVPTYFGFVGLIYSFFPERWLAYLLRENYDQLVIEGRWNGILVPTILLSALVVNLIFIFLSLTITERLRNRKK